MTALGRIRLTRRYATGSPDGGHFPADSALGVDGYVTRAAERMAVLAGVRDSFAHAEATPREPAGRGLDGDAIRRLTHAAAGRAPAARGERDDGERFGQAGGVIEVRIDAGKVNTLTGRRDVKLAVFAEREEGEPAAPAEWAERELPAPTARVALAAVEGAGDFAGRVRADAGRLRVTEAGDVTVPGDGAEWVWNLAAAAVPQAAGVPDIYHAPEHIGGAVRAIWGVGPEADERRDAGRAALPAEGRAGVDRWIAGRCADLPEGAGGDESRALAGYIGAHPRRVGYARRLASGRAIGSGLVAGSVKQLVNRRLKLTGARWDVKHVGPLVELAAIVDTPDWHAFWTAA